MRIKLDCTLTFNEISNAIIPIKANLISKGKIEYISTDSREIKPGDLFFALQGEKFNGEDFIIEAKGKGAYTVSAKFYSADFFVKDTLSALNSLALFYKKKLSIVKTIAITGSVGKTTTKELTLQLLSKKYKTHGTYKNYNNEIGVPLTVLSAKKDTEILVIEAGMNHLGELERISRCIEPDISVITKIGTSHIGNLGSKENIAKAKMEIVLGMKKKYVLIPKDEPYLAECKFSKTVSCTDKNADFYLSVTDTRHNHIRFNFEAKSNQVCGAIIKTDLAHITECLSFALGICSSVGMSNDELYSAILELNFENSIKSYKIGTLTLIDDSYNSSLESVEMAFKTLCNLTNGSKSAVLGDILELGEETEVLHRKIGALAKKAGISKLYIFGRNAKFIKLGAMESGMKEDCIFINEDTNSPEITALQIIKNSYNETIIFKASRKMKLERIIEILKTK